MERHSKMNGFGGVSTSLTRAHGSLALFVTCVAWLCVVLLSVSCHRREHEQLTTAKPYADLIGAEYEVISGDVRAYGISSSQDDTIGWIQMMGGVGVGGPEVLFNKPVNRGVTVKILSAWRSYSLTDSDDYYVVAVTGADLPANVPVRIELNRGNEGDGVDLNPRVYRRMLSNH